MKMLVFLTLFLCISSASGLQCLTCAGSCSSAVTMTCPADQMCVTAAISAPGLIGSTTQILKGCIGAVVCPSVGNQSYSFDYGTGSVQALTQCCNTDNCNGATLNLTPPPAGSLQCYGCNSLTNNCTSSVTCNTLETQCFSTQVQLNTNTSLVSASGCVSENLCNNTAILTYLGLNVTAATNCCNTKNCNAPPTTAPPTTSFNTTNTTASTNSAVGPALPLGLLHSLLGLLLIMLYF